MSFQWHAVVPAGFCLFELILFEHTPSNNSVLFTVKVSSSFSHRFLFFFRLSENTHKVLLNVIHVIRSMSVNAFNVSKFCIMFPLLLRFDTTCQSIHA